MNMNKSILATIMTASLIASTGAFASGGKGGVINFSGSVVNTPCGISAESASQEVVFSELSKIHLSKGGISEVRDLNIELVHCDLSAPEGSPKDATAFKSVSVTFHGMTNGANNSELATVGNTGAAVVIADMAGKPLEINSIKGSVLPIDNGSNTLRYVTWVKKGTGLTINEGEFSSIANFKLSYM